MAQNPNARTEDVRLVQGREERGSVRWESLAVSYKSDHPIQQSRALYLSQRAGN